MQFPTSSRATHRGAPATTHRTTAHRPTAAGRQIGARACRGSSDSIASVERLVGKASVPGGMSLPGTLVCRFPLEPLRSLHRIDQLLLEDDHVVGPVALVANADDVEAGADRKLHPLALAIVRLAADRFVPMLLGPGVLRLHELAADPGAAEVGMHGADPVTEQTG